MAVIWGLDLREIQWSKFKSSYMWNNEYHLRRTKFIIYQCAMIFCVFSESLGTAALSDYVDEQDYIKGNSNGAAYEYNNDYIGVASYNIFAGVFVATIFGAAFFFDLFWPARHESPAVKLAWRICGILACVMVFADALALTIITATHSAYITGVSAAEGERLLDGYNGSNLSYKQNGRAVASVVFIWPGFLSTVASAIVLWLSYDHNDKLGPLSTHARTHREMKEGVSDDVDPETGMMGIGVHDSNTAQNGAPTATL